MVRLIDADALKEHFKEYTLHSDIQVSLDRYALKVIEEEPTVDAVPVIRCKDCKHCMIFSMFTDKWYVCCRNEKGVDVEAEDFCSKAERKEK